MTRSNQTEFEALQATTRARGTTRIVLFYVGIAVWAALTLATTAIIVLPVAALLPLLVLAAGFEATAALHIGVEGRGADPIFSVIYVLATLANFLPVALTAQMKEEMIAIGALHALFLWRVLTLRRAIANQQVGALREAPLRPEAPLPSGERDREE
ncbi:MAG TPA: hypothetical protein VHJ58_20560 [Vicinamibacterales bacterium]|nr:hypothetical protein [Vicinamibacterales bacterium]